MAQAEIKVEVKEEQRVQLQSNRTREFGHWQNWHTVNAQVGTTRENILKEDYWAHVAQKYSKGDMLFVRADDNAWVAQYYITDCARTWVKVFELNWWDLKTVEMPLGLREDFVYHWFGNQDQCGVVRKSDGAAMIKGLKSKEQALEWIVNHNKTNIKAV
jgi:hypothetical protein